jgi:PAS domain S-box-containing protein
MALTASGYWVRLFAVAVLYVVAGRIGLAIPFTSSNVSPVWPASGVAIACLLLLGRRCWPGIAVAAFLVNFFSPLPPLAALGLAIGNTSAAHLGAFLLRQIPDFRPSLCRLKDVLGLLVCSGVVAPAASASIGSITFGLLAIQRWDALGPTWLTYYLGDMTGVLSIAPLLLSFREWARVRSRRRRLELFTLLFLLAAVCLLLFDERLRVASNHTVLAFAVFPFVLWAAIRFGVAGASVSSLLIGIVAVMETAAGSGPFSKSGAFTNTLLLQFFFANVAASGLLLAAVIAERENAEAEREALIREQAAQQAQSEAERRYRLIVEMANEGICTFDSEQKATFANRQFAEMLGYQPEEIYGKNAGDFGADAFIRPSPAGRAGEYRLRRKDSSDLWGSISTTPVPDERNGGMGALVMLTDITERKRAEERALKIRMELQAILDNSPALIYMKDDAGRYTFVNRCWSESFHTGIGDVRGKTDFDIFPEAAAAQFVANDRTVAEKNTPLEFEEYARFEDCLRSYHSIKVALRDGSGALYAICGISTDVTERKSREEALLQVHRALRVLSNCNSAVVHANEEQELLNEVCRVAVVPAGYSLAWVGCAENDELRTVRPIASAGPAEGFLDQIQVSWADNPYGNGAIGRAIREGRPVVVHRIREHADFSAWRDVLAGRSFQSVLAVPLRLGDSIFGALAIYADEPEAFDEAEVRLIAELGDNVAHGISSLRAHKERAEALAAVERARLELEDRVRLRTAELVEAKDAAESADRLKSAFLATMSHELRTPLNSIIGFTGIVLQGLAGPLNPEQSKQLGMVQSSARHLLALINDVLDISKIEAGQLEIACGWFSLRQAVIKAVSTISPLAQAKGISISSTIAPDVDRIYSDQRRTEQILLNLLSNAVKFTDSGAVTIECRREHDAALVSIRDTGVGIEPEYLQTIFEPFRQADSGLARKHEGTGLGLSICRRLVDRLGGAITVESVPGTGSTFTFQLPLELGERCDSHGPGY